MSSVPESTNASDVANPCPVTPESDRKSRKISGRVAFADESSRSDEEFLDTLFNNSKVIDDAWSSDAASTREKELRAKIEAKKQQVRQLQREIAQLERQLRVEQGKETGEELEQEDGTQSHPMHRRAHSSGRLQNYVHPEAKHRKSPSLPAGRQTSAPTEETFPLPGSEEDEVRERSRSSPNISNDMKVCTESYENRRRRDPQPLMHDRLTVFQAEPLVWFDRQQKCHPFPRPPDFRHEKETLLEAVKDAGKIGAKIDVVFETATTNRIAASLAAGDSRVLHLSGHGDKDHLAIENEWGVVQALRVDELKEFIEAGPGQLHFVFVSTCYSRALGEAFIAAGVPHVVCCHQSQSMQDTAAVEFARNLYRALSCGKKLRRAFRMAEAAVKVSPSVKDAQKFLLLPENPKDEDYHDVPVFYRSPQQHRKVPPSEKLVSSRILPPAPQVFIGRETAMHEILDTSRCPCVVQITGASGVGKSSLAKAVCKYVSDRRSTFLLDDIFWLPPLDHDYGGDELSICFRKILQSSLDVRSREHDIVNLSMQCCGNIVRSFHGRRVLIFIDAGEIQSGNAMEKIQLFMEVLHRGTEHVSVVLACPWGEQLRSKKISADVWVDLGPLTMRASVLLFGSKCKFVERGKLDDFVDLLVPDAQADATLVNKSMSKRCAKILSIVGEGIPDTILKAAENMTSAQFENLMKIGMREEFEKKVDTRVVLELEVAKASKKLTSALELMDYKQAEDEQAQLDELWNLRESLPTVADLRVKEARLFVELSNSVTTKDFSNAQSIHENLEYVRRNIKLEEQAMLAQPKIPGTSGEKGTETTSRQEKGTLTRVDEYRISSSGTIGDGGNFSVVISHGSIVDFSCSTELSAIVCSTNESFFPLPGGNHFAVMKAGGESLETDLSNLPAVDENNWGSVRSRIGESQIVGPGSYDKLRVGYVIFAVGPSYVDIDEGRNESIHMLRKRDELLRSAYQTALELARCKRLEAVAFSLISSGTRAGVHYKRTLRVTLDAVCSYEGYRELKEVHLCAFESHHCEELTRIARELGVGSSSQVPTPIPRSPSISQRMWSWLRRNPSFQGGTSTEKQYVYCPKKQNDDFGPFNLVVAEGCVSDFCYSSQESAIVCATNESCFPIQGSVDSAIGEAGGIRLREDVKKALGKGNEKKPGEILCPTGDARILGPKFYGKLQVPYVIFAVGPIYSVSDGDHNMDSVLEKDSQLRAAYQACLALAEAAGLEAVAFSLLSAGKRAGSDQVRPLRIAVETMSKFCGYKGLQEIRLYGYYPREVDTLNRLVRETGLILQTPSQDSQR